MDNLTIVVVIIVVRVMILSLLCWVEGSDTFSNSQEVFGLNECSLL